MLQVNRFVLLGIFVVLSSGNLVSAEDLIASASHYSINATGSFCSSVGESIISEMSNGQYAAYHGFQQPSSELQSNISNPDFLGMGGTVFPNPTVGQLTIKMSANEYENSRYRVCDLSGNILLEGNLLSLYTQVDVRKFSPSIYLLKIFHRNQLVGLVKILKSNHSNHSN